MTLLTYMRQHLANTPPVSIHCPALSDRPDNSIGIRFTPKGVIIDENFGTDLVQLIQTYGTCQIKEWQQ